MATDSDTSSKPAGDISQDPEKVTRDEKQNEPDIESKSTPQPSRLSSAIQTFSPNW
jgi:hypothetical protein